MTAHRATRMRERHVRFAASFITNDSRMLRRSDAAQALYLYLEARCLELKCEFLPAEYDAAEFAFSRRRTEEAMRAALEELATGPRPLIGYLPDGRIRAIGVRSKHGDKISWRDEREEFDAWADDHGPDKWFPSSWLLARSDPPRAAAHDAGDRDDNADDRGGSAGVRADNPGDPPDDAGDRGHDGRPRANDGRNKPANAGDVDVEVDSDTESPPPPRGARPLDIQATLPCLNDPALEACARHATAGLLRRWETKGFRLWRALNKLLTKRLKAEPLRLVAHVHDLGNARRPRNPFAMLYSRLARPDLWAMEPSEKAWDFAREAMREEPCAAPVPGLERVGVAETPQDGSMARRARVLPGDPSAAGKWMAGENCTRSDKVPVDMTSKRRARRPGALERPAPTEV